MFTHHEPHVDLDSLVCCCCDWIFIDPVKRGYGEVLFECGGYDLWLKALFMIINEVEV